MWELDSEESWALKNWCFWTVVLENTLESPLDYKEIQPVHPKGDHSSMFIGRTDAEAETPVLWPPHAKSWLTGKDPEAGRDWAQEEKGTTEDEMAGWHHWLDGHEFESSTSHAGSWWWTGRPGVLWFMGSQSVGYDWMTELNWTDNFDQHLPISPPLLPQPMITSILFFVSVSLTILGSKVCEIIHHMTFSVWLIHLAWHPSSHPCCHKCLNFLLLYFFF